MERVKNIVTIGEIMMRLSPLEGKRFSQSDSFNINFGGAEANVAVLLSRLGENVKFVTKLPRNPIGEMALEFLKGNGIDTSCIAFGGDRLGVYYFEKGNGVRSSKVVYDRKDSSMANLKEEEFNINSIFKDADLFHVSGITPALGTENIKLVRKCIDYCLENNIKVSVDLNYRSKLWSFKDFTKTMKDLIKNVDLVFGWIDLEGENNEFSPVSFKSEEERDKYFKRIYKNMNEVLGVKAMVTTLRENISTSRNALRGIFINNNGIKYSNRYEFEIIDRVGAGDAFAGGVLYKILHGFNSEECIEFGVCAGVYKHTVLGDALIASEEEINSVRENNLGFGVSR